MKLATYTITGKKTADTDISLFDNAAHPKIVAQAVRVFLSNQRSGSAATKTRGEVLMTKSKWYKQKGTGRARHGAQSAPLFVGGGVAHGPRGVSNWKLSMSKTMRRRALETALAIQANDGKVVIVDGLEKVKGKTSEIVSFLTAMEIASKAVLIVVGKSEPMLLRATNNMPNVFVCPADNLTTYYVARAQKVLLTPDAVESFQARFAVAGKEEVAAAPAPEKKPTVKKTVRKVKTA